MSARVDWISEPAGPLHGEIDVAGDKSISHRAIMLAALAEGTSHIDGFLESGDTRATVSIFAAMGVAIDAPSTSRRIVHGVGLHGLRKPRDALDCGNSGTAMRLLAGLLAGQRFAATLTGDASLARRPMRRIVEPLLAMGARIENGIGGLPPLHFGGGATLRGVDFTPPVASAQIKSALLLAGLYAEGETWVRELHPTRDYTERLLSAFGWPIACGPGWARLAGVGRLRATDVVVPADFSSAAFFIVAATLVPGSDIRLRAIGLNPRRTGLLAVLRLMGADVREIDVREVGGECVADLHVRHSRLHGTRVPVDLVPDMIDEFPILFVAAAAAAGTTTIRGAAELRVKESDRIAVMAAGLRELGAMVEETPDGARILGAALHGGTVDSAGDHRCAMAFAVAGLIADAPVRVADCANVATSFPDFAGLSRQLGFALREVAAG